MIKLYGNPYSRANRVRWALEETGQLYEEELVTLDSNGTRSKEFTKINPNSRIPVINDEGLILFESIPICIYIAKKYGADFLYVKDIKEEGLLLQWSVWAMTELEKYIETASLHMTWYSAPQKDLTIGENAQNEVIRCLNMLESTIKDSGYIVGKKFTIADLIVTEVLTGIVFAKISLDPFPSIRNYLKKNLSRPAATKAFAPDIIEPYLK